MQTQETNTEAMTETKSLEEQQGHLKQMSEFQAGVFAEVVAINLKKLTRILKSNNGVTELQKQAAETALIEAVKFALDFGVEITGAKIRDRGTIHAGVTNELASSLVKAMDNRTLLLALQMQESQEAATTETNTESTETQGEQNV